MRYCFELMFAHYILTRFNSIVTLLLSPCMFKFRCSLALPLNRINKMLNAPGNFPMTLAD